MLPNVFPELQTFCLDGRPLVVKNTFVDVVDPASSCGMKPRSSSVPVGISESALRTYGDLHPLRDEPLHEVRSRALTSCESEDQGSYIPPESDQVPLLPTDRVLLGIKQEAADVADITSIASTALPSISSPSVSTLGSRVRFHTDFNLPNVEISASLHTLSWNAPAAPTPAKAQESPAEKTTLMFRNLPVWFNRSKLEELLHEEGFAQVCDFIYLPAELGTGTCFGYAFINMATNKDAEEFIAHFHGFERWVAEDGKRAVVHVSEALQGLSEQIERYRNSPLMHESVADDLRPAVYSNGVRVPFPAPTAPLQPPRLRTNAKRKNTARGRAKTFCES